MNIQKTITTGIVLLAILILLNVLAAFLPFKLDMTEDNLYTLTKGSKSLIEKIEEPITMEFFFSRSNEQLPIFIKNYARRVEEMLRQYDEAGGGDIILRVTDPKPDSKEEEQAARLGISGQPLPTGEQIYFGLAITQADQTETIPFFNPNREQFLEYDISKALYAVQILEKPKMGLLTSLPMISEAPPPQPGMPPQPGGENWVVIQEWERQFDIVPIESEADFQNEDFDVLAVVHPDKLAGTMSFEVDQFILSGKPTIIMVDPSSRFFMDRQREQGMMGMMPNQPVPNQSSDLKRLFSRYGIRYNDTEVVADPRNAATVNTNQGVVNYPVWLNLQDAGFNREALPTADINQMLLVEPGYFTLADDCALEIDPLIQASPESGTLNNSMIMMMNPSDMARQIVSRDEPLNLTAMLRGNLKTAFPDGQPKPGDREEDEGKADGEAEPETDRVALKESLSTANILLVADTDWLQDQYSVRRLNFLGMNALQPLNNNLAFASNAAEFMAGNDDLISIRTKGTSIRTFEVVKEIEMKANKEYQAKLEELDNELNDVQTRLREALNRKEQQGSLALSPEAQQMIEDFRVREAELRSERREIKAALREDIEMLEIRLLMLNTLVIPSLVVAGGIFFFIKRRRAAARFA